MAKARQALSRSAVLRMGAVPRALTIVTRSMQGKEKEVYDATLSGAEPPPPTASCACFQALLSPTPPERTRRVLALFPSKDLKDLSSPLFSPPLPWRMAAFMIDHMQAVVLCVTLNIVSRSYPTWRK